MERTQIYLLESQKEKLDALAKKNGKSVAEIIREAVDMYMTECKKNTEDPIVKTFGIWKDRDDISDSSKYVTDLRDELNSRLEDIN